MNLIISKKNWRPLLVMMLNLKRREEKLKFSSKCLVCSLYKKE
jgi:hypothetical protein